MFALSLVVWAGEREYWTADDGDICAYSAGLYGGAEISTLLFVDLDVKLVLGCGGGGNCPFSRSWAFPGSFGGDGE